MAPLRVVEKFNVVEHVGAGLIAGSVDLACRAFGFQRREEAFHGGIVPDVARAAHAAGDAIIGHELLERLAGVLAALVRVVQQCIRLPRRQIAIISASVTSCAVIAACIDQPTTRRKNRSITAST